MKTFKMMTFSLLQPDGYTDFPIIDGLVINQENSFQTWVLEMFISNEYEQFFESLLESGDVIEANVIISFPDNEPAKFSLVVVAVQEIDEKISVLLKGKIISSTRKNKMNSLFDELARLGLSEDEILAELKKRS